MRTRPKLRFRFHEPTIDTNLPLTDGTVEVEGFDLELVDGEEADAWDCGFGALLRSKVEGQPWISIPAFPNRKFRVDQDTALRRTVQKANFDGRSKPIPTRINAAIGHGQDERAPTDKPFAIQCQKMLHRNRPVTARVAF